MSESRNSPQHTKFCVNQIQFETTTTTLIKNTKRKLEEKSSVISLEENDFHSSMEDIIERFRSNEEEDKLLADEEKVKVRCRNCLSRRNEIKGLKRLARLIKQAKKERGMQGKKTNKEKASASVTVAFSKKRLS